MRGLRADLAALGLGAFTALALPPVFALPVLLVSFPALLAQIDAAPGPAVAARRGWWFGFGMNLVGLYWITEAILIEAARFWWLVPFAVPAVSAILAVFVAVAASAARLARAGWPRAMGLAGAWVLADLARQFVATGFPWNLLGSVWEFPGRLGDVFIQPAAWISIHGLTLLTVLLALTPALRWRWRGAGAAVLAAWAAFGLVRLHQPLPPAPGLNVVLVQGNVAEGQKWDRALLNAIFDRYLRLTRQGMARSGDGPAVVVWPETAFPGLLQQDAPARQAIMQATRGNPALIGSVRYDRDDRPRNSLFALTDSGTIAAIYDKWHLVPFGEYQPAWFPAGIQIVPGGGFTSGPGPRTLHVPGLPPVGPLICYEAIFPGRAVDPNDRPAWMVNVTNDAWFGNSSGPRQHLAAARMRAVEEGLPLLRAANTGITAAFDARGHEVARLGRATAGTLVVPLPSALPATPFARFGLAIPILFATGVLALGLLAGRIRSAREA
ncbi:MAG TPA: apolipoprotein N-acyltransferase [Acetobacteraceae bacterium]|nr:apolipoprotein N-acyltransferase [Acetobacteraceae bacterium]